MDVTLRQVTDDDLPWLRDRWARVEAEDPYNWFGHRDFERPRTGPESGLLLVLVDGARAGDVGWRTVLFGLAPWSTAFEIGISLEPEFRGRGVGAVAQRLLAEHVFAHTTANRVQATTDVTNVAEQRALERAGFTREGVLRGAQWRSGAWHDLVVYAVLRGE